MVTPQKKGELMAALMQLEGTERDELKAIAKKKQEERNRRRREREESIKDDFLYSAQELANEDEEDNEDEEEEEEEGRDDFMDSLLPSANQSLVPPSRSRSMSQPQLPLANQPLVPSPRPRSQSQAQIELPVDQSLVPPSRSHSPSAGNAVSIVELDDGDGGGGTDSDSKMPDLFSVGEWCSQHGLPVNSAEFLKKIGVVWESDLDLVDEDGLMTQGGANLIQARRIMKALEKGTSTAGSTCGGGVVTAPIKRSDGHYAYRKAQEEKEKPQTVRKRKNRIKSLSLNTDAVDKSMVLYRSRVAWIILCESDIGSSIGVYKAVDGKTKGNDFFAARYQVVEEDGESVYPNAPAPMIKSVLKDLANSGIVNVLNSAKSESFNPLASKNVDFTRVHVLTAWDKMGHNGRLELVQLMDELESNGKNMMDWELYIKRWKKTKEQRKKDIKVLQWIRQRTDQVVAMTSSEIAAAMNLVQANEVTV